MKRYLLATLLGLASCATERVPLATDAKVDSALVAAGIPPLAVHKLKLTGPVTMQVGQGNSSSTVGTDKTGQRAQAVSTGAGSPIQASQKKGGVPWWVFAFVGLASIAGWEWLSSQVPLGWLRWRAR
ncbi:hypothetical protein [Hymenobacter cheonanensis]|uniref:hypothetical protein n=1 Tax=Hymenobacter sp. CA2-7 TaxID=3063993 RepID=UPI0027132C76|nr:hypothetical protein [Hymenobacter sp. CA2-7]MDO7886702.1 hypothetical protein [Hymenobacter sp. CA2-7]